MIEIRVDIPPKNSNYKIFIGYNIFDKIKHYLAQNYSKKSIAVICDSNLKKAYSESIINRLNIQKNYIISFPSGEKSKDAIVKEKIEIELLKRGIDRNSLLLTFGGGVTGDLGGYVAATYFRGVPFIQVPTSLLAMVDSSIGGKVAINNIIGKNLIGAFYQPDAVFIDIKTLETLPDIQFINGFAEIVKTALIRDVSYYYFLKKNIHKIFKRDTKILQKMIQRSCELKSEVVMLDEKESGLRKILNYGHTIGHAIEKISNYKILHGFSVSIGMNIENIISEKLGLLKNSERKDITDFLKACKLPVDVPSNMNPDEIFKKLRYDKKSVSGIPRFSLLDKIGNCIFDMEVEKEIIRSSFLK